MTILTRHFYVLDEVIAALQYCCMERQTDQAIFWLLELIDSGEIEVGLTAMLEVYIIRYGVSRLQWFYHAYQIMTADAYDRDAVITLCYNLAKMPAAQVDISLLGLSFIALVDTERPPQLLKPGVTAAWVENYIKISVANDYEAYLCRALYQGKVRGALWAVPHCRQGYALGYLQVWLNAMNNPPLATQMMEAARTLPNWSGLNYPGQTCMAFCFMIMASADKWHISLAPLDELPSRVLHQLELYEEVCGTKQRRVYSIPTGCLYLDTHRGCLPYTQTTDTWFIEEVGKQHLTYQHMADCDFWNTLWNAFKANESDEGWEHFCQVAFPEDIPDEWSLEERSKSHGHGSNNPNEKFYWRRWLNKWRRPDDPMYYLSGTGHSVSEAVMEFIVPEVTYGWSMAELFQHLDSALIAKGHITVYLAPEAFVAAAPDPLADALLGKMKGLKV
jgi:hypothetical protein